MKAYYGSFNIRIDCKPRVNPELRDGECVNIEEFYKHEVGLQKYDVVVERMKNNMQIHRHRHLLRKQMHGVYIRHTQRPQQGSLLTDVQRLPLDINQKILGHAYGKEFNREPSWIVDSS